MMSTDQEGVSQLVTNLCECSYWFLIVLKTERYMESQQVDATKTSLDDHKSNCWHTKRSRHQLFLSYLSLALTDNSGKQPAGRLSWNRSRPTGSSPSSWRYWWTIIPCSNRKYGKISFRTTDLARESLADRSLRDRRQLWPPVKTSRVKPIWIRASLTHNKTSKKTRWFSLQPKVQVQSWLSTT